MGVKMKEVLLDDFIPTLLRSNTFNFNDYHLMPMTLRGVRPLMEPKKKTFCGFPWVETSTAGRVYDLCFYYMTGAPKGSPKVVLCGFMVLWRNLWESGFTGFVTYLNIGHWQAYMKKLLLT